MSTTTQEHQGLSAFLRAADCVFKNDITAAEAIVDSGDSSFERLGKGLLILLKTSLGFEGIWAKFAAESIAEAERLATSASRQSSSTTNDHEALIFPHGSAEALCAAQAQLASAMVAVTKQSMFEYMRGLYKIRQSYLGLRKLTNHELDRVKREKMTEKSVSPLQQMSTGQAESQNMPSTSQQSPFLYSPDRKEAYNTYNIHTPDAMSSSDEYTYTGAYLCFGTMLIGVGMIPSAFQYVLRIVGFKGDKERGMAMLWEVAKFRNPHGALASLILLSLYNAIRSVCDIVEGEGFPKERCEALLDEMLSRYPTSVLWILEQGRQAASHKRMESAIEILETPVQNPPKQLTAMILIEKTMYQMMIHDYASCTRGFLDYTRETKYSHALFYYNAGCAQVELYRALMRSNPEQARIHKNNAQEYFNTTTIGVDKKKLMATELPFDTFVTRKLNKWRAKAKKLNVDLVDAVGPSPIEEMIYYHGGHKWMTETHLEQSLSSIAYCKTSPHWEREDIDERCIYALLKGVVLRAQGQMGEAKVQFDQVIAQERVHFSGKLKDDWVQPSAHYELAIIAWNERKLDGNDELVKLRECAARLNTVSKWGSYELDTRLVIRVHTAQDIVKKALAARN